MQDLTELYREWLNAKDKNQDVLFNRAKNVNMNRLISLKNTKKNLILKLDCEATPSDWLISLGYFLDFHGKNISDYINIKIEFV